MKAHDIHIRDPFILAEDGKYYLFGTRFNGEVGTFPQVSEGTDVYVSHDLKEFSEPKAIFRRDESFWGTHFFWAPEVHKYRGRYYMFVTVASSTRPKGVQILVCDTPDGTYIPVCNHALTPESQECLDGTLWVENGVPYMIYCHEWTHVKDGEMCIVRLSDDLTETIGEPAVLFTASQPSWATGFMENNDCFVTDGPFLYRAKNGRLLMIWSSIADGKYVEAVSYSDSGIMGPWEHYDELLYSSDGGHGMIFKDLSGRLMFTMHHPNTCDYERPRFTELIEKNGVLKIK